MKEKIEALRLETETAMAQTETGKIGRAHV